MKMIRSICVLIAAAVFMASEACAISWEYDLDDAIARSKKEGKPVMADFYTDWCGWCKKLDNETYKDKAVSDLSQKFLCVKVNGDAQRDLTTKYRVNGYPTVIFFPPAAKRRRGLRDIGTRVILRAR